MQSLVMKFLNEAENYVFMFTQKKNMEPSSDLFYGLFCSEVCSQIVLILLKSHLKDRATAHCFL